MVEVAWMVNGLPSDRHGAEIPEKESREVRYFTGTNVDLNRAGSNGGRPAPLSRFERLVPGSRWHGAVGIEELARGCDQFPASSRRRGAVAGYLPDVTST
jgi:hypothetical protein